MALIQHDILGDHWALINKVIELTGYTDDAIRAKVHRKDWTPTALWRKAPDGHLVFNIGRIQAWMSGDSVPASQWGVLELVMKRTGYSKEAIQKKVGTHGGPWKFGTFWRKAPDGRRVFNLTRIQAWLSSGQ